MAPSRTSKAPPRPEDLFPIMVPPFRVTLAELPDI